MAVVLRTPYTRLHCIMPKHCNNQHPIESIYKQTTKWNNSKRQAPRDIKRRHENIKKLLNKASLFQTSFTRPAVPTKGTKFKLFV